MVRSLWCAATRIVPDEPERPRVAGSNVQLGVGAVRASERQRGAASNGLRARERTERSAVSAVACGLHVARMPSEGRPMEVGFHIVSFDWPDQPRSIAPTLTRIGEAAEAVGASDLTLMDHWFQMESFAPASDPMMEGYTTLGYLAGRDGDRPTRPARHRCHVPAPGAARQDRRHARRPVGRPRPTRHRRRLVRAGARRPRRAVPTGGGALRVARRDAADLRADVERRRSDRSTASTSSSPRRCASRARSRNLGRAS